jgi:hypothetical protein
VTVQYEKTFDLAGCVSGVDNFFELRFPARGELNKLIIVQASGAGDGFEFDLYNSRNPLDAATAAEGSSSSAESATFDAANYKIIPTQIVAAAALSLELLGATHIYPYANRDGSPTNMKRFLYIRIKPTGSVDKDFQLTLGMLPPDL